MSLNVAIVPEGMSYVNAFRALWENSKPAAYFNDHPEKLTPQEATVGTPEKVVQFFKTLKGMFVDYAGGRLIQTSFEKFPVLTVHSYDRNYGIGAAQKALTHYNQIPSKQRFDSNDQCRFSELPKKFSSKL